MLHSMAKCKWISLMAFLKYVILNCINMTENVYLILKLIELLNQ